MTMAAANKDNGEGKDEREGGNTTANDDKIRRLFCLKLRMQW